VSISSKTNAYRSSKTSSGPDFAKKAASQTLKPWQGGNGLLLAYYGDDFTGSTDAMEALAKSGAKTVLFLEPPTRQLLADRFPHVQCVGVAGISRSLGPAAMESELGPIFEALRELNAPVVHYKVCSTFDSSPQVGSIGKAIDVGLTVFGRQRYVPVLAGVPVLGRYTVFGHHFAASLGGVFRLDRHPVMSRHPVTPMDEADLLKHLAKQTDEKIGLISVLDLNEQQAELQQRLEHRINDGCGIVFFDVLDEPNLHKTGELLWKEAERHGPIFTAGSSGVEYALATYWRESGLLDDPSVSVSSSESVSVSTSASASASPSIPATAASLFRPGKAGPLLVVSGSCSPVTAGQIAVALRQGFVGLRAPVMELADPTRAQQAEAVLISEATVALEAGSSVVIYTSLGPEDDTIGPLRELLASQGIDASESGKLLGRQLGRAARSLVMSCGIQRLLVAGGDTSGYLVRELGIYALELLSPLVPGGPLCHAYAEEAVLDGLQLCLKGGQVGPPDFFRQVLEG
jgi:uncharacterized protein YgbK (DUF1537 family)